jgi:hypothetical protein
MTELASHLVKLDRERWCLKTRREHGVVELAANDESIDKNRVRTRIIGELLESLSESRKIMLDQNKDLKTRERWTQLHMSTSQTLNTVLRDLHMRDWEERLKVIEEYNGRKTKSIEHENPDFKTSGL